MVLFCKRHTKFKICAITENNSTRSTYMLKQNILPLQVANVFYIMHRIQLNLHFNDVQVYNDDLMKRL